MLLNFTSANSFSSNPSSLNVKGVGIYTFSSKEEKKRVVRALKAGLSLGQALRCWDQEVFEKLVPPPKKQEKQEKNYLQEATELLPPPKSFEEEQVLHWLKSPRRLQTAVKLQIVGYPGTAEEKSKANYISDKGMYYLDGKWKKPHASLTKLMQLFGTLKIKDLAKIFNLYEELTSHKIHIGGGGLRIKVLIDMACEDKFARLPSWVKAVLFCKYLAEVNYDVSYDFSCLGEVSPKVFIPCAKAWKWDTSLPKKIAYRVGLMEVKQRVLASIAWKKCYQDKATFWEVFEDLLKNGCSYEDFCTYAKGGKKLESMASILTGVPYGILYSSGLELNLSSEVWENFKKPSSACAMLFGFKGKATVKAYLNSGSGQIKWVRALAVNHDFCVTQGFNVVPFTEDYAQKILSLPYVIEFEDKVVKLLSQLQMSTVLKLLTQQEFKYRGELHPLNPDHIRDCGYMWNNLEPRPNLGRVRCWFSLHELLSEEFVKQQPDEPIPFLKGWEKAHNLEHDGWRLVLPTNTSELKLWGKFHRCCIGAYGPKVKAGDCQVFSVWEGFDMTHLVEVSSEGEVLQFNSPGNNPANEAVKKSVIDKLRKLRLVIT